MVRSLVFRFEIYCVFNPEEDLICIASLNPYRHKYTRLSIASVRHELRFYENLKLAKAFVLYIQSIYYPAKYQLMRTHGLKGASSIFK